MSLQMIKMKKNLNGDDVNSLRIHLMFTNNHKY